MVSCSSRASEAPHYHTCTGPRILITIISLSATIMNSLLKPPLTFFLPLLLLVSRAKLSPSQRLPGDGELFVDPIVHQELFYENGILPDGAEMRAYAFHGRTERFFFVVEEDNTPVAIVVTPCSARIEWNLTLQEPPEDGSAGDQLSEQRPRRHRRPTGGTVVKIYSGYDVSKYVNYASSAGIYVLEVRSVERGSSFQIYSTTTPESDHFFPELPSDSRVDVTSYHKNRVSLAWKPSPTNVLYRQPVRYCIAVNSRRNYHTWCGVQASVSGGFIPPFPSSTSGFGFESERAMRRARKKMQQDAALISSAEQATDMAIECVGRKTLHTITNLQPGLRYYFDLFAIDERTNRSVAYTGTSIVTRPEINPDRSYLRLKDGRVRTSSVRKSSPVKQFRFPVSEKTEQNVLVTVQPCSQHVTVEVWRGGSKIRDSSVKSLKNFTVRGVQSELIIKVKGGRRTPTYFKIFAKTNPTKYPFPILPKDSRIKVYKTLRQCTSLTLAWLSTGEVSQYCLYMRKDSDQNNADRQDNRCHGPEMRKKSEKIVCRVVNGAEPHMDVLTEMVTGLTPGTKYVFDVYVSGNGKETLSYRSKKVTTKRTC